MPDLLPLATLITIGAIAHAAHAQSPSPGWRATCESRLPATVIEVRTEPAPVRHTHDRSIAELTRVQPPTQSATHALGLTEMRTATAIRFRSPSLSSNREPVACTRPHIEVTLSLSPHTVSVARELPEGSCGHRHVTAHELRHVQVNQLALEQTATRLREALQSAFGNTVFYGTPAELEDRLGRNIRDEWLPWVTAQMNLTLQKHREIDTPEEYARNRTVCNGEIARVLDGMR